MAQKMTKKDLFLYLNNYTVSDIAKKTKLSERTIYRLIKKYKLKKEDFFSKEQEYVFLGTMLGSGCVLKDGRYSFKKSNSKKTYVDYIFNNFKPYSKKIYYENSKLIKSSKEIKRCCFVTKKNLFFQDQRLKWYNSSKKEIPNDILINPVVLFHWHCNSANVNKKNKTCFLSTSKFSLQSIEIACNKLMDLGIKCNIRKKRIFISKYSYFDYMKIVNSIDIKFKCFKNKFDYKEKKENKIDSSEKRNIIESYKFGNITQKELAKKYNVSEYFIWKTINEDIKVPSLGGSANINIIFKAN